MSETILKRPRFARMPTRLPKTSLNEQAQDRQDAGQGARDQFFICF